MERQLKPLQASQKNMECIWWLDSPKDLINIIIILQSWQGRKVLSASTVKPISSSNKKLWFTPGNTGFNVFQTGIGPVGIMICFDWLFPESMRTLALQGAQVIAHPANLVLPHCPSAMPIRCLENKVYAITVNRTGREQRKEGSCL